MDKEQKLARLKSLFAQMDKALIAYSGGVDSTLVAKIAYEVLGETKVEALSYNIMY